MDEKISRTIVDKINSLNWYKFGHWQSTVVLFDNAVVSLTPEFLKPMGFTGRLTGALGLDDDYFVPKNDFDALADFFFEQISKNPDYFTRLATTLNKTSRKFLNDIKKIETLENFFDQLKIVESLGVAIIPLDTAIEKYVQANNLDRLISNNVYPIEKAYMIQERIDFLAIAIKKYRGESVEDTLVEHAAKFGWMKNVNWRTTGYDSAYYSDLINSTPLAAAEKELATLSDTAAQEKEINEFVAAHDTRHKKLLGFLRELLDAKMLNWDVVGISQTKWQELIRNNRFTSKLPYDVIINLTSHEVMELANGHLGVSAALRKGKDRLGHKIVFCENFKCTVYPVNQGVIDGLDVSKTEQDATEFSGSVAYPGLVTAKIKIVRGTDQVHDIEVGEVLVCPMTNPDLMPAIIKASAIITDEGGLLCHAAIIAREMKKPCITGTKIATKVLKDGDLVEVDADKGIVRILEKA